MTLLEVIKVLERRGKHVEHGKIEIGFDNRTQCRNLVAKIKKSNMCAQEAGVEIAMMKHVMKKIKFEAQIKLVKGHEEQIGTHDQNPLKHLMRDCDRRARKTREEISKKNKKEQHKILWKL